MAYRFPSSKQARQEQVVADSDGEYKNVNVEDTMNVVPLAFMTQMMDQRSDSAGYVRVLN